MVRMTQQHPAASLDDMIAAITKTFVIAHEQDTDAHLAQALVYNAGRLAWRMREQGLETEQKTSVSDVVTLADRAAEDFIAGALAHLRPEDGILGEEGAERASTSGRTWVIDPVDGTYNFATGSDYYCSAVALVEGSPADPDKLILGAVHRPAMGYTWMGGPEIPTTRDGRGVDKLQDVDADQLCLGTYIHPSSLAQPERAAAWMRVVAEVATLRMLGAGSIDLASVADGTLGVWVQHSVADWDWLPGLALVQGAGGTGVKVEAGGVTWCVAGNSRAVEQVTSALTRMSA
ncbi:MAG: inositol monophosphatase family protein [Corynebacterium sp.]|uniref:inositol monophosphatase family protein n=1 Tax=Corynebacterium sp. TaxID=1720 RepID=UPI0026DFBFDE|nr:inositol monophosphatase family protein [Corynebacterium sp.]MDO5670906.1 inositol monophosphatase family protein [Corynebacterium sp.]